MVRIFYIITLLSVILVSVGVAMVGGGDIRFKGGKAGEVIFRHDTHAGLKCTDCHDSLYVTREKDRRFTMAQIQKGKSCGACHNGKQAFEIKSNCANCHKK